MENLTWQSGEKFIPKHSLPLMILTITVLGLMILCTIIGNILVIAAILLERNLRNVSNYLIVSLAVADLMVATFVMPISALREISQDWWFGKILCDVHTISDVLCCTASILHLVGVALDRYWAVTQVDYIRRRSAKRIFIMIACFWLVSVIISIPSIFGQNRLICRINTEMAYTLFSTVFAFYMPMFFMIAIYLRIYQVAMARIRKTAFQKQKISEVEGCSHKKAYSIVESNNKEGDNLTNGKSDKKRKVKDEITNDKDNENKSVLEPEKASYKLDNNLLNLSHNEKVEHDINILHSVSSQPLNFDLVNDTISESKHKDSLITVSGNNSQWSSRKCRLIYDSVKAERKKTANLLDPEAANTRGNRNSIPIDLETKECLLNDKEKQTHPGGLVYFMNKHRRSLATVAAGTVATVAMCSSFGSTSPISDEVKNLDVQNGIIQMIPHKEQAKKETGNVDDSPELGGGLSHVSSQLKPTIFGVTMACAAAAQLAKDRLEQQREKKASLTLAIITGCFLLCWLPFFIVAFIRPFYKEVDNTLDNIGMNSVFLWLGYVNSMLNPVIYTIFSPDFRNAFRKILFGNYQRERNRRKTTSS